MFLLQDYEKRINNNVSNTNLQNNNLQDGIWVIHIFKVKLKGKICFNFLQNVLPNLIKNVKQEECGKMEHKQLSLKYSVIAT